MAFKGLRSYIASYLMVLSGGHNPNTPVGVGLFKQMLSVLSAIIRRSKCPFSPAFEGQRGIFLFVFSVFQSFFKHFPSFPNVFFHSFSPFSMAFMATLRSGSGAHADVLRVVEDGPLPTHGCDHREGLGEGLYEGAQGQGASTILGRHRECPSLQVGYISFMIFLCIIMYRKPMFQEMAVEVITVEGMCQHGHL